MITILQRKIGMDALTYAKDSKYHGNTKHIKIIYHFVKDLITHNEVVADPFTKPIARDTFVRYEKFLGLYRILFCRCW